ncbi:MAG: bifunctional methionine sulfoxide reductase B/A protein [Bacteroidetes bacterium]|nr:bifunctional methionine sulfoxide reductase B/A protein [Bacteroidota bacterium]
MKTIYFLSASMLVLLACISLSACAQTGSTAPATMPVSPEVSTDQSVVHKTDAEWKKQLSNEQYYVLREKGTEAPYSGKLLLNKEKGIYKCAACGNELFSDDMKFDSHCGWPSFDREIAGGKIKTVEDNSHGMQRTEIMCARCGGHLGHLFNDGPTETGMRYCVNSLSLEFVNQKDLPATAGKAVIPATDTITLGGGCFWCVEAVYEMLDGVKSVESGFSGGTTVKPSYADVCTGSTGHAEVVQLVYDPAVTSLDEILKVFFTVHDPTTLNRQGADVGTQYRSVIFYRNDAQRNTAKSIIDALNKDDVYGKPVVTQLDAFKAFYKAEDYHQDYYNQNKSEPYCRMVIQPKIEKFEKLFKDRLKKM